MEKYQKFLQTMSIGQLCDELESANKTFTLAYKIGYKEVTERVSKEVELILEEIKIRIY